MKHHILKTSSIFVLFLFIHNAFTANSGMSCSAEKKKMVQDFEKALMSCAMHSVDFSMMEKIIENINHLEKLLTMEFICGFQKDFAKLTDCMVNKYMQCLPQGVRDMVKPVLPSEAGWEKIIKFGCDNRKVLSSECMTVASSHAALHCYKDKLQDNVATLTTVASTKDVNPLLCSVRQWSDQCLTHHTGTCSSQYMSLIETMMAMVTPGLKCTGENGVETKLGSAVGSILLHGQPLLFQPHNGEGNNVNYNIQ